MTVHRNQFYKVYDFGGVKRVFTAGELVEACLDGSDYERGQIEEIKATAGNTQSAIARLTQILYDRKLITRQDVYTVADQTNPDAKES